MHEIRCLIVEDEKLGQDILIRKIQHFFPRCRITGVAESVKSAIDMLHAEKPEIVFMDVQIKGGTAFDILSEFPRKSVQCDFSDSLLPLCHRSPEQERLILPAETG